MQNRKLRNAIQLAKNLFITGAFKETSRGVELEICARLPQGPGKVVVEYGMGHGNITREILSRLAPDVYERLMARRLRAELGAADRHRNGPG